MPLLGGILLLVGTLLTACARPASAQADPSAAVVGAVLDSLYNDRGITRYLVAPKPADALLWLSGPFMRIGDDTSRANRARAARQALSRVEPTLADDFVRVNASTAGTRPSISAPHPIVWDTLPPLPRAARDSLLRSKRRGEGFERYARAYPGVTIRVAVSRVGLSADRRRALVYVESWCGVRCGAGVLYTLELSRGRWRIVDEKALWAV